MTVEDLMQLALAEAGKAREQGEVPIGAIVWDAEKGEVIGRGYNRKETSKNATAHAEMLAIQEACQERGDWRLSGCVLVSTCEPCAMCTGALIQSRIARVIFGCRDEKFGALGSIVDLRDEPWNHHFEVEEGVREEECRRLLQEFFRERREENKEKQG